jgi:hypothetical protein
MTSHYHLGTTAACIKLGLQLTFNSAEEAEEHARLRRSLGETAGVAGNVAGGLLGGISGGSVGGAPGALAGGIAGAQLGGGAAAMPATTLLDVIHDVPQKTRRSYANSQSRLNAAAGMPTGAASPF